MHQQAIAAVFCSARNHFLPCTDLAKLYAGVLLRFLVPDDEGVHALALHEVPLAVTLHVGREVGSGVESYRSKAIGGSRLRSSIGRFLEHRAAEVRWSISQVKCIFMLGQVWSLLGDAWV